MARVNVWIPDRLLQEAHAAGLNVSRAAQAGIRAELAGPTVADVKDRQDATAQREKFASALGHPPDSVEAVCPHPPKERTSYGVCQRCKAVVVP